MSTLVRLRIALADRPGALAAVAAVIAGHGGNITGVDVHRHGDRAVDDLTVEFADAAPIDAVRAGLDHSGAGALLTQQTARQRDPAVAALQRAGEMAAIVASGDAAGLDGVLCAAVAEVCGAPVVWLGRGDDPGVHPAGALAVERAGAVTVRATDLPGTLGESLPGDAWLLAVPDPGGDTGGRVAYVARGSAEFTATEVARVEALMSLAAQFERAVAPASGAVRRHTGDQTGP
jgi:hypothetical protein